METYKNLQFKILYEKYFAAFCIYAKRFLKDKKVREDIVSDVFANLWFKTNEFDLREETAVSYIKTSIKNSCLNYLKHKVYEPSYLEELGENIPVYSESPEKIYTLDEMYKLLYNALQKLPDNLKKVFIESFLKEKKQSEVAEELNLSVKTVSRYQKQIIELLRKELKDYLPALILLYIITSK